MNIVDILWLTSTNYSSDQIIKVKILLLVLERNLYDDFSNMCPNIRLIFSVRDHLRTYEEICTTFVL